MNLTWRHLVHRIVVGVYSIVILLKGCETSATVVLGAAASLLVAEMLTSIGCEETFGDVPHVSRLIKRNINPPETSNLTNMLGILTASLHLGLVVWLWERLLLTSHVWDRPIGGIIKLGPVVSLLQHDRAVAELLHETVLSLNGGVGDLGHLVALETIPALVASRVNEVDDIQRINKVYERVANIAVVCEINAQIHEVILSPTGLVDNIFQHGLVYFVWDISEHDGSADVGAFSDFVDVDVVVVWPWWAETSPTDPRSILPAIVRTVELG